MFDNSVVVSDDHLLHLQRQRYAKRNVHEAEEEDLFIDIITHLPAGSRFVNVGTAIGYYPILARKLRNDIHVHCFEPLPRHLRYFRENILLNGMREKDFMVHNLAVGTFSGKAAFDDRSYGSVIVDGQPRVTLTSVIMEMARRIAGKTTPGARFYVNSVSLPDVFAVVRSDSIEFLQMDIQGFEQPVLEKYFAAPEKNPGVIQSFLVGTHGPEIHAACANLLANNGYSSIADNRDPKEQPDGIIYARIQHRQSRQ